jgi:signal peptidase I
MSRRRDDRPGLWKNHLRPILMIVTVLAMGRSSIADWNDVPTQSMEPTILVGDRIAVNKLAYGLKVPFTTWHLARWDEPATGEVIVFFAPLNGQRMVKRVIGVPGDRISMRNNQLHVNGVPVGIDPLDSGRRSVYPLTDPPPYAFARETIAGVEHDVMALPARRGARRDFPPLTVPAGHYFVMGDNRDNSGDSRWFGFVPRDRVVGRAFGVAISLDQNRGWRPRWRRFLRWLD